MVWCLPPPGVLKFNIDGSSKGNPCLSGCGRVLRNETRTICAIFSGPLGSSDADYAELLTQFYALDLFFFFSKSDWKNRVSLIVESDSKLLVDWFTNKACRPWKYWDLFLKIDSFLEKLDNVSFCKVPRIVNGLADFLTKEGVERHAFFSAFW
ncbi:hypothetical protein REPUB_Repub06bG0081400 [Reevesia pubescens]